MKASDYPCKFRNTAAYWVPNWIYCTLKDERMPLMDCKICQKREEPDEPCVNSLTVTRYERKGSGVSK